MKMPRVSTLVIVSQSVLLLACFVFVGFLLFQSYVLKLEAKRYASIVGTGEANRNFSRGRIWFYEVKQFRFNADGSGTVPDDGSLEPSGRSEGKIEIYYYLVHGDLENGHLEIQQAYVDAYNERMHQFVDHPEWFDKEGHRIPASELKRQTNSVSASN
jgi:hypothetical protein